MKKTLFLMSTMILFACEGKSKLDSTSKNVALENVKYAAGAAPVSCEPAFQLEQMHSVRCTMPSGAKVYCVAGQAGWGCFELTPAPTPPPQPVAAPAPTPAPVAPAK